jgi:hypothetical protein
MRSVVSVGEVAVAQGGLPERSPKMAYCEWIQFNHTQNEDLQRSLPVILLAVRFITSEI